MALTILWKREPVNRINLQTIKLNYMRINRLLMAGSVVLMLMSSCVSKKVLKGEQTKYVQLQSDYSKLQEQLKTCTDSSDAFNRRSSGQQAEIADLHRQIDYLNKNNTQALKQLENLSVISSSQAESI